MARGTAASILACCVLMAGACGAEEPPALAPLSGDDPEARAARTTVTTEVPTVPEGWESPVRLTLLDPGAEPRRPLRVTPEVGTSYQAVMGFDIREEVDPALIEWIEMPRLELTVTSTVIEAGDGVFVVEQTTDPDLTVDLPADPAIRSFIEGQLDNIARPGFTARTTWTDRLEVVEVLGSHGGTRFRPIDAPTLWVTDPEQAMPLPAEAVGVGARWRIETTSEDVVGHYHSEATVELVESSDDQIVMRVDMSSIPAPEEGTGRERLRLTSGTFTYDITVTIGLASGAMSREVFGSGSGELLHSRSGTTVTLTMDHHSWVTLTP